MYDDRYAKDVDLWVYFVTKISNVEDFQLFLIVDFNQKYLFPQFAYNNDSLRNLDLRHCILNPNDSVNWSNLISLSIGRVELTDSVVKKILSGCPNLECLNLGGVSGIHCLEISSVKLKKLSIDDYYDENHDHWLEIIAPYIQKLCFGGMCREIRIKQRNVASLVSALLHLNLNFGNRERISEKEFQCFKELLHSIAHVEELNLGNWCLECLSILELKGWQFPPSSRKILYICVAFEQLDFPGICCFLQSSLDLETLIIDWYDNRSRDLLSSYINEDEQNQRFETHNFDGSFPHLKNIKILQFNGSVCPLVKYLLKHATVLEKFVIVPAFQESDVSPDYFKESDASPYSANESDVSPNYAIMALEFLSYPRSSPHASVIFSY